MIDATQNRAIGKSRGGLTTKTLAMTNSLGNPGTLRSSPGPTPRRDGRGALMKGIDFCGLIADKAFDANWIVAELNERGAKIVIAQMLRRKQPLDIDRDVCKGRNVIENVFCTLQEVQRLAVRSDKTDTSFAAHGSARSRCYQLALISNTPEPFLPVRPRKT